MQTRAGQRVEVESDRAEVDRASSLTDLLDGTVIREWLQRLALAGRTTPTHLAVLRSRDQWISDESVVSQALRLGAFTDDSDPVAGEYELVTTVQLLLADQPGDIAQATALHGAFAVALTAHGGEPETVAALGHARAAADWSTLNELWVRHGLGLLNRAARKAQLAYAGLPREAFEAEPFLVTAAGYLEPNLVDADWADHRVVLQVASRRLAMIVAHDDDSVPTPVLLHSVVGRLIHERAAGALDRAVATGDWLGLQLRHRLARGDHPAESDLAWYRFQHSLSLMLVGQEAAAAAHARDAYGLALAAGIDAEHVVVNAASQLALLHAMNGSNDDAREWLERADGARCSGWFDTLVRLPSTIARLVMATDALDEAAAALASEAAGGGERDVEMWAHLAVAQLRHGIVFGDPAVALVELDRSIANHLLLDGASVPAPLLPVVAGARAEALIALSRPREAIAEVGSAVKAGPVTDSAIGGTPDIAVPFARALLHAGEFERADRVAKAIADDHRTHRLRDRVEAQLISVEARVFAGDVESAVELFRTTSAVVEHMQAWRLYALMTASVLQRMTVVTGLRVPAAFSALRAGRGPIHREPDRGVSLTARERVVLGLLVAHPSAAEIAEKLTVSPNTVKKQLASIYSKLGVGSRDEALRRADMLDLLVED